MPKARHEETLSEHFGALLFQLREARGLSQRAAAKLVGVSNTRLMSLENGKDKNSGRPTLPSPELTVRIAQAYRVPKDRLLMLAGYLPWLMDEDDVNQLISFAKLKRDERGHLLGLTRGS